MQVGQGQTLALGKAAHIVLGDGLGDDQGPQQGAGQHAGQFGVALGLVQPQAAAGIEGEDKGNAVLFKRGQEVHRVVEEVEVSQ